MNLPCAAARVAPEHPFHDGLPQHPRFVGIRVEVHMAGEKRGKGAKKVHVRCRPRRKHAAENAAAQPRPGGSSGAGTVIRLFGGAALKAHILQQWPFSDERGKLDIEALSQAPGRLIDAWLRTCDALWRDTKNPLLAWLAYSEARRGDRPVPGWVSEYLDEVAHTLLLLSDDPPSQQVWERVGEALGMKRPGRSGAGTVFSRFWRIVHKLGLSEAVERALAAGHKTYIAHQDVAHEHGLSSSTVRRAHRKKSRTS